jgi:hypothetical protein
VLAGRPRGEDVDLRRIGVNLLGERDYITAYLRATTRVASDPSEFQPARQTHAALKELVARSTPRDVECPSSNNLRQTAV